jgi:hypothetical protein
MAAYPGIKVMYDTNGKTTVRCPNPSCQIAHVVDGKVTELWVETVDGRWTRHDVQTLVVRYNQQIG